jgi:hypothetical protein
MFAQPDACGSAFDSFVTATDPEGNLLYPDDLDPPESCGVPLHGPFGKDEEIFLAPWREANPGSQFNLNPGWYPYPGMDMPGSSTSNIAAVAQGTEQIVAAWTMPDGKLYYSTWRASDTSLNYPSPGGWSAEQDLGLQLDSSSSPALLSRNPQNWVVFAHDVNTIKYREWNNGMLATDWLSLDGVENVASDLVVISKDPNQMAVFYRDSDGAVWFTEGQYGGDGLIWRSKPVSLSNAELSYTTFLPLVSQVLSETTLELGNSASLLPDAPAVQDSEVFTLTSDLNIGSRNENHLAVLGVDANHQLWIKEWTHLNESDWSDTAWVMLMDNVMIERPAVASRHSNHLAVAVRNTLGEPFYIEWSLASGWKTPLSLEDGNLDILTSPLTLAAISVDKLYVLTGYDNKVWHKDWNEETGWGQWQENYFAEAYDGMILTAVVRRINDLMVLGHDTIDNVFTHYTSQDQGLLEAEYDWQTTPAPRQVLANVGDKTLWVRAQKETGPSPSYWMASAFELDALTEISGTLVLNNHPIDQTEAEPPIALATSDLDLDGDQEIVVATRIRESLPVPVLHLSVLDLAVSPTLTVTTLTTEEAYGWYLDVSVAAGDLDGDGVQNEVVLGFTYLYQDTYNYGVMIYQYQSLTSNLQFVASEWYNWPWVGDRKDVEVAVGKLYPDYPGEQIILVGTSLEHETDRVKLFPLTYHLSDGQIIPIHDFHLDLDHHTCGSAWINFWGDYYRSAVVTGDMDADGYDETAIIYCNKIHTIDTSFPAIPETDKTYQIEWQEYGLTSVFHEGHTLAVGDIDLDGRDEFIARPYETTQLGVFEIVDDGKLIRTADQAVGYRGAALIGDVDTDSFRSDLAGCKIFSEVSVIAVLNGAPRWYETGVPINDSAVRYAKTSGGGSSSEWGTSTSLGSSLSIGFAQEINIPLIGTKVGEIRGSVTQDFMSTLGQTQAREESVTISTGYADEGETLGFVVYNKADYTCYYYDVYSPSSPSDTSMAMSCRPVGNTQENVSSLEYWHSPDFKMLIGASWVDVGHRSSGDLRTNDVTTYPTSLPIDEYTLKFIWDTSNPIVVSYDVNPIATNWTITEMAGGSQGSSKSFETNTTVSMGATIGSMTMDTSITNGSGWESSRIVSWTDELEIGGGIDKFTDPDYTCYLIVPYIYHAKARTLGGTSYPYLEMDYYVPELCSSLDR